MTVHDDAGDPKLPWKLLGVHFARMEMDGQGLSVEESLGLNSAWYADILLTLTVETRQADPSTDQHEVDEAAPYVRRHQLDADLPAHLEPTRTRLEPALGRRREDAHPQAGL